MTFAISPLLKDITLGALTTYIYILGSGLDPTLETLSVYSYVCVILSPAPPLLFETSICAHTGWSQLRFVFLIRHRSVIATPRFTVCPPTLSISDDRLLNSEAALHSTLIPHADIKHGLYFLAWSDFSNITFKLIRVYPILNIRIPCRKFTQLSVPFPHILPF